MEHYTKAAEKQAINNLWHMGGYFHDMIDKYDICRMLDNIENDFALECGTFIDKQRSENKKLAKRFDNLSESYDNVVEALAEEQEKTENAKAEYKEMAKKIRLLKTEVIRLKVLSEEPLTSEEKDFFNGIIAKVSE